MIRIARVYNAKPGKMSELREAANDVRIYMDSQGVTASIFTEPYGDSGRLHWHVDFDDAGTAHETYAEVASHERGQEFLAGLESVIEGHAEVSFRFEEE